MRRGLAGGNCSSTESCSSKLVRPCVREGCVREGCVREVCAWSGEGCEAAVLRHLQQHGTDGSIHVMQGLTGGMVRSSWRRAQGRGGDSNRTCSSTLVGPPVWPWLAPRRGSHASSPARPPEPGDASRVSSAT